jgi:hypothetical protein
MTSISFVYILAKPQILMMPAGEAITVMDSYTLSVTYKQVVRLCPSIPRQFHHQ